MISTLFISNIFSNPIYGMLDSFIMKVVKSSPTQTEYWNQRLTGAIGFGLFTYIAGVSADNYHYATLSKYTACFFVFLPIILLLIPAGLIVASQSRWETDEIHSGKQSNKLKLLLLIFRKFDNIFFILSVFVAGTGTTLLAGFLFKLMEDFKCRF